MLFGPVWGVVITWTGAMLGAALAFALARWFGRPFVDALLNERQRLGLDRWMHRQGVGVLLLSRLMPLISFNVINYAAGLTPISWWTFLWTTGLGILPITTLLVVTGDRSGTAAAMPGSIWLRSRLAGALLWFLIARRRQQGRALSRPCSPSPCVPVLTAFSTFTSESALANMLTGLASRVSSPLADRRAAEADGDRRALPANRRSRRA